MALNASGPISLAGTTTGQSIEIELLGDGTTTISLNDSTVRTLAGIASGTIEMPTNFYGKSNRAIISYTFSASTANASLNVSAISGYVAGKSDITVTVNSGVYLWASTTGNYGFTLSGSTPGDTVTVVNNGYIIGCGGAGGAAPAGSGGAGGPAFNLSTAISLTNNSYIAGGGGGGGGGQSNSYGASGGGGGAGGGSGGYAQNNGGPGGTGGGAGGAIGSTGANGGGNNQSGGGGGRILPGAGGGAGGANGGGAGGGGGSNASGVHPGAGGSANNPGGSPSNGSNSPAGGGGGGWSAAGHNAGGGGGGGAGGKAINLNGYTITYLTVGTIWGTVS